MLRLKPEYCRTMLEGANTLTGMHIDILSRLYDMTHSRGGIWFEFSDLGCERRDLSKLLQLGLLYPQTDKKSGRVCYSLSLFCYQAIGEARELAGEQHREILLELQRRAEYGLRDAHLPVCNLLLRRTSPASKYLTPYDLIAEPPVHGEDKIEKPEELVIPYTFKQRRMESPYRY